MSDLRDLLNHARQVRKQFLWSDKAVEMLEQAVEVERSMGVNKKQAEALQRQAEAARNELQTAKAESTRNREAMEAEFGELRRKLSEGLAKARKDAREEIDALKNEQAVVAGVLEKTRARKNEEIGALEKQVADLTSRKDTLEKDIKKLKARVESA